VATSTEQAQFTRRVREVVLTAVVGLFGLMTLMWALEKLRALLVLVLFSLFCGFALEPAVNKLARRGWPRGRATLAVFFLLSLVVGAFAALLGTIVVQQVTELVKSLPDYATNVADYLRRELGVDISGDDITGSTGTFSQVGKFVLGGALVIGATVL
jgi:predicted PurR-regulated permease PerM